MKINDDEGDDDKRKRIERFEWVRMKKKTVTEAKPSVRLCRGIYT